MISLDKIPVSQIKAVFTDLDDTLTDEGKLHSSAYEALWKLKQKGFWVVLVSGRPAGWADCLMRLWPIDAIVFENGAGVLIPDGTKQKVVHLASLDKAESHFSKLKEVFMEIQKAIPGVRLASDQPFRLFDMAIDICEEPPALTEEQQKKIMHILDGHKDITYKLSSIHINYWVGNHTKVTSTEWLLENLGKKRGIAHENVIYCGDSPNDEPLFEFFKHSMGVANVKKYLGQMQFKPKYISQGSGGVGFGELVDLLTK